MVKITIENLAQKEVAYTDLSQSFLSAFQAEFIDWMHACGGKGRCTTCKMVILAGADNLSEPTRHELNYRKQGLLKENERLACQTRTSGDCKIRVPEESKLPHLHYTQ